MRDCVRALLLLAALSWLAPVWAADSAAPGLPLKPRAEHSAVAIGFKAVAVAALALLAVGAGLWHWRHKVAPALPTRADDTAPLLKSSRRISRKTVLLVVQWRGRLYLLAENGDSVRLLDDTVMEETER